MAEDRMGAGRERGGEGCGVAGSNFFIKEFGLLGSSQSWVGKVKGSQSRLFVPPCGVPIVKKKSSFHAPARGLSKLRLNLGSVDNHQLVSKTVEDVWDVPAWTLNVFPVCEGNNSVNCGCPALCWANHACKRVRGQQLSSFSRPFPSSPTRSLRGMRESKRQTNAKVLAKQGGCNKEGASFKFTSLCRDEQQEVFTSGVFRDPSATAAGFCLRLRLCARNVMALVSPAR